MVRVLMHERRWEWARRRSYIALRVTTEQAFLGLYRAYYTDRIDGFRCTLTDKQALYVVFPWMRQRFYRARGEPVRMRRDRRYELTTDHDPKALEWCSPCSKPSAEDRYRNPRPPRA
jgi:hypothetical protein